ncbi:MAG: hypothetical protein LBM71_04295, partial [Elusimicrobiota bacterium]|nr:hypothetical protein [Elusimicrobiota bacterium]
MKLLGAVSAGLPVAQRNNNTELIYNALLTAHTKKYKYVQIMFQPAISALMVIDTQYAYNKINKFLLTDIAPQGSTSKVFKNAFGALLDVISVQSWASKAIQAANFVRGGGGRYLDYESEYYITVLSDNKDNQKIVFGNTLEDVGLLLGSSDSEMATAISNKLLTKYNNLEQNRKNCILNNSTKQGEVGFHMYNGGNSPAVSNIGMDMARVCDASSQINVPLIAGIIQSSSFKGNKVAQMTAAKYLNSYDYWDLNAATQQRINNLVFNNEKRNISAKFKKATYDTTKAIRSADNQAILNATFWVDMAVTVYFGAMIIKSLPSLARAAVYFTRTAAQNVTQSARIYLNNSRRIANLIKNGKKPLFVAVKSNIRLNKVAKKAVPLAIKDAKAKVGALSAKEANFIKQNPNKTITTTLEGQKGGEVTVKIGPNSVKMPVAQTKTTTVETTIINPKTRVITAQRELAQAELKLGDKKATFLRYNEKYRIFKIAEEEFNQAKLDLEKLGKKPTKKLRAQVDRARSKLENAINELNKEKAVIQYNKAVNNVKNAKAELRAEKIRLKELNSSKYDPRLISREDKNVFNGYLLTEKDKAILNAKELYWQTPEYKAMVEKSSAKRARVNKFFEKLDDYTGGFFGTTLKIITDKTTPAVISLLFNLNVATITPAQAVKATAAIEQVAKAGKTAENILQLGKTAVNTTNQASKAANAAKGVKTIAKSTDLGALARVPKNLVKPVDLVDPKALEMGKLPLGPRGSILTTLLQSVQISVPTSINAVINNLSNAMQPKTNPVLGMAILPFLTPNSFKTNTIKRKIKVAAKAAEESGQNKYGREYSIANPEHARYFITRLIENLIRAGFEDQAIIIGINHLIEDNINKIKYNIPLIDAAYLKELKRGATLKASTIQKIYDATLKEYGKKLDINT